VNNDNIKINNSAIETNVVLAAHNDIILSDNKNLMYENTRTGKLQLSGLDFQYHLNTYNNYSSIVSYGPGGIYVDTQDEYLYFDLYAPIKLPQNVTITKMTIVFAASIGTSLDIKVTKKTPMELMGEGTQLMDIDYTFNTTDLHSYSYDGLNNATIDNDYVYFLDLEGYLEKEEGAFNAGFSVLTITLEYEYNSLNH